MCTLNGILVKGVSPGRVARWLALAWVLLGATGCADDPDVLLLTITAERPVGTFDLVVWEPGSGEKMLWLVDEPVDSEDASRDISQPDQALKIAVGFRRSRQVVVHVVGHTLSGDVVATQGVTVNGATYKTLHLIDLGAADQDGDGFADEALCETLPEESVDCDWADCNDAEPAVSPLANEVCGNGEDENCDDVDAPCEDADGDGSPAGVDCDDNDPNRFPENPERPDGCPTSDYPEGLADPGCDDDVDQNCDGQDVVCVPDADCDGYPAEVDCDDNDPDRNPGAPERCDNQTDDNCDGVADENCVPCDLDGDGFQREDVAYGCPTAGYPPGQPLDCDDFDAGVAPDVTDPCGGAEGGDPACNLRALCDGVDNDCDGDVDEGCAPQDDPCDGDRDGYQRVAPGCSPLPGQADCDDQDPTVYPGAPDLCGDGELQNCNTDFTCATDGDGDGYLAADDCDDSDPTVHPWAAERCNGVDDDCDGLVDEGNPDGAGDPLGDRYCNDIGIGACGDPLGAGRCLCSATLPGTVTHPTNRSACPDEDLGAASSPRCFFAPAPAPEQCDTEDHDCNGVTDDPEGLNLLELGWPCGTDDGQCVAGQVTGCDLSVITPGADNPHYLCTPSFVGPAADLCNGLDENCVNGLVDDGVDECALPTPDCCGAIAQCVDLQIDMLHCGQCEHACDPALADRCVNGNCRCGDSAPCPPGKVCMLVGTNNIKCQ